MTVWCFKKGQYEPVYVEKDTVEVWICEDEFKDMDLEEVKIQFDKTDEVLSIITSKRIIQSL